MQRVLVTSLVICFFLSGAVALVYQTIWVRMFTIVFGNSSYAVSTVLCAFMAGLGLGSWYFGRIIDRYPKRSVLMYGMLELGIAVSACAVLYGVSVMDRVHTLLYGELVGSNAALALVRFILAFVILIVPTTLMGGTLPVLVRFFVRRREKLGTGVGTLYAANTAGAVLGCFLTGFYLIGILGISRAIAVNVALNLAVGLASLVLYVALRRTASISPDDEKLPSGPLQVALPAEEGGTVRRTLWVVLFFAGLAGMTSLAYEVFWTRVLVFYMNNSVYAFSSMLTVLLTGLAVGGYLFGKIADRQRNLWLWFAGFEFTIGLWAIFAFPAFDAIFHRFAGSSRLFEANFWGVPVSMIMMKSAMLILVPTILMGATFPLLAKLYARNIEKLGRNIGNIYSKNTIGSMVGAFAAGFIVIPLFGIQKGVIAVAAVNMGLALAAVWMSGIVVRRKRALVAVLTILAVAGVLVTPKEVLFRRHDESWSKLLFYEEDNTATVKVYELPGEKRVISINGYEVAGARVSLHEIQKALGHYPVLMHYDPRSALIIGFGAGGTSHSIHLHGVEQIDLVEIVPAVLRAAPYLEEVNHGVLHEPNFRAIIDDGRNYVHATTKTYDVITVDSVDPKHAGNGNLYTVEFYKDCLSKLNPGGIMAEWIPYHLLSEKELKIIMKSFAAAFPHKQLWFTPFYSYFVLIGSPDEIVLDYGRLADTFRKPALAAELRDIGLPDAAVFLNTFAMDETAITRYVSDIEEINTYDRPRIEFFRGYDHETFGQLPFATPAGRPLLVNLGGTKRERSIARSGIESYRKIARDLIAGRYFFTRNEYSMAAAYWRKPLAYDAGKPPARYMLAVLERSVNQELGKRFAHIRQNPDDAAEYFEVGQFCEKIQKRQAAIKMYRKAIELQPDFELAYNNLSLVYGKFGDYDRALSVLNAAVQANPASLISIYNMGVLYYLKGDYRKAEDICRKALAYPAMEEDDVLRSKLRNILQRVGQARAHPYMTPS